MPNYFNKHWHGQTLVRPGVYVHENLQGGIVPPNPNKLVPLIIGDCFAGQPGIIHTFVTPDDAINTLRGGDLLTGVLAAFSPSPELDGPDTVLAIRLGDGVDAPVAATHTFGDSNPGTIAVQSIAITGTATAGTAVASYNGTTAPSPVAYNASASAIQSHLNTIPAIIAAGGVTSSGTILAGPIVVTFVTGGARTHVTLDVTLATGATAATTTDTTIGVTPATPTLVITAADYGQFTNGISLAISPATKPNAGYKIELAADPTRANKRYDIIADNVGRQGLKLRYLGSGTAVTLTLTRTNLTTTVTGAAADNLSIDLTQAQNSTIHQVVAYINAFGGGTKYAADVADLAPGGLMTQMDLLTAVDITAPMTVLYTGAGSAATLAVTVGATDTTLSTTCTGAVGDNLAIAFSGYTTMADLAAAITGITTPVTASGIATYTGAKYTVALKTTYASLPIGYITPTVSPISIKTTAAALPGYFGTTQHLQGLVDYINLLLSSYVTASLAPDTTGVLVGAYPLATVPATYLTGGADANPNGDSWDAAIALATHADCQIVVPLTAEIETHAAIKAHCAAMSSPKSARERIAIVGGAAGETKDEALGRSRALGLNFDGDFIQLVWPGVTRLDPYTSLPISYPPYIFAAQKAGLSATLGAGEGATNKLVDITDMETLISSDDLEDLINGAVCSPFKLDQGNRRGFIIGKDMLTYQEDANFIRSFFMTRMAALISSKRVRESLGLYVGEPNTKALEQRVMQTLIAQLDSQVVDGLLVAANGDRGWRNLSIRRTTDTFYISYEARVVTEADFFLVEANFFVDGNL